MKKIALLSVMFTLLFTLIACDDTGNVVASFDNYDITISSVSVDVDVDDPDSEITGSTYVKLYLDDEEEDSEVVEFIDGETSLSSNVEFTGLDSDTTYEIKVIATMGKKNVEIISETFTTFAETEVYISTAEEFLAMKDNKTGTYILSNDIDFSDVEYDIPFPSGRNFSGSFDGQGYTLSNITIDDIGTYTGVFGYVSSGEIKNVNLENVSIGSAEEPLETSTSTRLGFAVGYLSSASGEISNVHVSNSNIYIESESTLIAYVGGIVGEMRGQMENVSVSDSLINVKTTSYGSVKIGGVVGYLYADASLHDAFMTGSITYNLEGSDFGDEDDHSVNIGGVIGRNLATDQLDTVSNIYSLADIDVSLSYQTLESTTKASYIANIGGLVGESTAYFEQGFYGGSITLVHETTAFETNVSKLISVGGLLGTYAGTVGLDALVRVGDDQSINVDVSEDARLNVNQLIARQLRDVTNEMAVLGTQYAIVNGNTVTALVTSIDDIDELLTDQSILDAYALVYAD